MKKEQIIERTYRIYTTAIEAGTDLGKMSTYLIGRITSKTLPVTCVEEGYVTDLSRISSQFTKLVEDNSRGRARISDLDKVIKSFMALKKEWSEVYGKELRDYCPELLETLNKEYITYKKKVGTVEDGDTEI